MRWWVAWCAVIVLATAALAADEARPLREAKSANGRFVLRVDFGRATQNNPVPCRATLYAQDPNGQAAQRWEAVLANDVAPSRAFVSDDGQYLVTLDEYRRGGARAALVIYGPDGGLLRHFLLSDLLGDEDWPHVKVEGNAVRWLDGATVGFSADGAQFDVKLASGRALHIDLATLDIAGRASGSASVPAEVRALLDMRGAAPPSARPPPVATSEPTTQPALATEKVPHPDAVPPPDYAAWLQAHARGAGSPAMPLYLDAGQHFNPWTGSDDAYDALLGGDDTLLADPNVAAWLASNADALRLLREGSQRAWLGADYARGADGDPTATLLDRLSGIRQMGRAALVQAEQAAAAGDPNAACDWRLTVARTGAQVCRGGTLLEDLTGVALLSTAYEDLLRELSTPRAARPDYAVLAARLDALDDALPPFATVVRGEQALAYDLLQRSSPAASQLAAPTASSAPAGAAPTTASTTAAPTTQRVDPLDALDAFYDAVAAIAALPYPQARREFLALEAELSSGTHDARLALLAAKFERSVFLRDRTDTLRRGVRLLVLVRAYQQQKNGKLPETLAALGDDRWLDEPLSGKAFVYRLKGGDCLLYSVGADGVDDGGIHHSAGERLDYVIWPRPR